MQLARSLLTWLCLLGSAQAMAGEPSPPPVVEVGTGTEPSRAKPAATAEPSAPPLPGAGTDSPASPPSSTQVASPFSKPGWAFAVGYSVNVGFHGLTTGGRIGAWYWLPESGLNAFIAEIEAGTMTRGPSGGSRGLTLATEYRAGTGMRDELSPSSGPVAAFYVTAAPAMHLWSGGAMFGMRVGSGVKFTVGTTGVTIALRYETFPILGAGVEGLLLTLSMGD